YVNAVKGHGGGWPLAKPLHCITLLDIHRSLSEASLFTIGLTDEHTNCPIEKAVNLAIDDVLHEAGQLVLRRFAEVTLDKLAVEYAAKLS
ncbi:MAG TPA: transcriptional regulator, partial [Rheinheimera sp.]|nr:transcriptional regulator [Rheinheimera sp.]